MTQVNCLSDLSYGGDLEFCIHNEVVEWLRFIMN